MEDWIKRPLHLVLARILPTKIYIKWVFNRVMPYKLNLTTPTTLNEKINVSKLDSNLSALWMYVDKLIVRDSIDESYLIPLLAVFDAVDHIKPENIPKVPFIAKTNHDSSGGVIVRDPTKIDLKSFKMELSSRLQKNHWELTKEFQYKPIKKKIIFEALLLDEDNKIPNDYKFNCFNGKVEFIYASIDREGLNYRKIYDINWEPMDITWTAPGDESKFQGPDIEQPIMFAEMIQYAEKLSQPFPYVRIDLYNVNGKIYFGEFTFMHGSGLEPILPSHMDNYYGSLIRGDNSIR